MQARAVDDNGTYRSTGRMDMTAFVYARSQRYGPGCKEVAVLRAASNRFLKPETILFL